MARIPIVNENDEIISYVERSAFTLTDLIRTTALWIQDENGNILLNKRTLTRKFKEFFSVLG